MIFLQSKFFRLSVLCLLIVFSFSYSQNWALSETQNTRFNRDSAQNDKGWGTGNGFNAPMFNGTELSGKAISLNDYAGENLLLVFASPGCPHCKKKVPLLNSIVQDGDLKVVMVISANAEQATEFKQTQNANFDIIADGDYRISQTYGIKAVPQAFLIEGDGRITVSTISDGSSIWNQLGSNEQVTAKTIEAKPWMKMEKTELPIGNPINNALDLHTECDDQQQIYCPAPGYCVTYFWGCINHQCEYEVEALHCFIDGECYNHGDRNPVNEICQVCSSYQKRLDWTNAEDGTYCDDGNECTGWDQCTDGVCAGQPFTCEDDGLTCTTDLGCNGHGCDYQINEGYCVIGNEIIGFQCVEEGTLNPANRCQSCIPSISKTGWSNSTDICNDGDSCTHDDVCSDGICAGEHYSCDDGLSCTLDVCNGDGTCSYIIQNGQCLIAGVCYNNSDVNPNNPCKECRDDLGSQYKTQWYNENSNSCSDNDNCTHDDQCVNGTCAGTSYDCDDGLSCTTDICNGDGTCSYVLQSGSCLIDGVCYNHGEANPEIACQECRADLGEENKRRWSLADRDIDGVDDCNDNCLNKVNPDQTDWDEDGKGDKCDAMGLLRAWGKNNYNQSNEPTDGGYVAVEAGIDTTIALKQNGSIAAWGRNNYGERSGRPSGGGLTAISLRCNHCLALRADGSVVGWGRDDYYQATPPVRYDIVAIGTGLYHSIALTEAGNIIAWGRNLYNVLSVPTGNDFVAISANDYHNVALRSNGTITSWGYESSGVIGNTPTSNDFIAVAAGVNYSIALKSDGSIVAWGAYSTSYNAPPAGNDYVAISAGYNNNLALRNDGTLAAWGENFDGETSPLPAGNTYTAISSGDSFNTAIMNCNSVMDGDINFDCYTNLKDLKVLSLEWLRSSGIMNADLDGSDEVDFYDFVIVAQDWMLCTYPLDANCQ